MAHIAFPTLAKSVTLPSGPTYAYAHVTPKDDKPYVLLLHGFPSSSYDWRHQIAYFSERGYGLIVPDLLGYGGTSQPKEKEAYRMKKMCGEVIELLDAAGVTGQVVGVGHDWGSFLLSRLANYHPTSFSAFCWMDVGYWPPSREPFSIDAMDEMATQKLGRPVSGYWHFFNSEDAGPLMDRNPLCTDSVHLGPSPDTTKDNMCPPGAARIWFEEQKVGPIADWISPEELAVHDTILALSTYTPPLMWYKAQIANINHADESSIPESAYHVTKPTLLVACTRDPIGVAGMQIEITSSFVDDLKVAEVETGHWNILEGQGRATNEALEGWLKGLKTC